MTGPGPTAALADDDADAVLFLPLGGSGEIGMNLNLYRYGGKWLMIDCGITFGDDETPGIDVIMPDPQFIVDRRAVLVGLVLTHAHEDHIGAVPYLWPRLQCPIFATPFTAAVLRRKLADADFDADVTVIPMSGRFSIDPFELELVTLTHSIPEPSAVVLRTPAGTVLHTGDWKLDPEPLVGDITDSAALRSLGDGGVLAMICDSTNALVPGESGSEASVRDSLRTQVGNFDGRVAVTCFASNIARVRSIAEVAAANDRSVALIGRSLWRMTDAARETGYFDGVPKFVSEHDAGYLPNDKVLYICTGSQGEARAALARIARNDHPHVTLERGDTVIFSSRIIPGNEKSIGRLQNQLAGLGVHIVTERDAFVHVSGHPARDEMLQMYQWVRPHIAVPVHGEMRHMLAHAELARSCQVPHTPIITNGDILRLSAAGAEIVGQVPHGRLALDGTRIVPIQSEDVRNRQNMLWHGSAVLTLVVDAAGEPLGTPQLSAPGLLSNGKTDLALRANIIDDAMDDIVALPAGTRRNDAALAEAARRAIRRSIRAHLGKRPPTDVHVVRV